MEINYHERKINWKATLESFAPGDTHSFPWPVVKMEVGLIRSAASKIGGFSINKTEGGLVVTKS